MPNRMFDPVSNPFAIQNLLEKKRETFVTQPDERGDASFVFDSVAMANPDRAFSAQTIEDPAATDRQEFQAAWVDDSSEFAGAPSPEVADFVAGQDQSATGFSTVANAQTDGAETSTDAMAPVTEAMSAESAADLAIDSATAAVARSGIDADVNADIDAAEGQATQDKQATSVADAIGDADASADDRVSAEATEDAIASGEDLAAADAGVMPEPATADLAAQAADNANIGADIDADADLVVGTASPQVSAEQAGISEQELNEKLDAAREQGRVEARAEAHQQGYDEGYAAGYALAQQELAAAQEEKLAQLQSMLDAMQALSYNADALFEPMKKLSIHLAEQLVRGELAQSPQVISRLVDNCLRELNASGEKAVIIHLNPEDLEQYKPQVAQFGDSIVLRPDSKLDRGSVRASLEGSVVEDLIQRRVAGLKKGLAQAAAPSWRAGGGSLSQRLADGQRGSQHVDDVTPTTTTTPTTMPTTVAADAIEGDDA